MRHNLTYHYDYTMLQTWLHNFMVVNKLVNAQHLNFMYAVIVVNTVQYIYFCTIYHKLCTYPG